MYRLNPFSPGDLHIAQGVPPRGGYISIGGITTQTRSPSNMPAPAGRTAEKSRSANHPTLNKMINALSFGREGKDLSLLSRPFFAAVQTKINTLKSAMPDDADSHDHVNTHDVDPMKIGKKLPAYLLNKRQMAKVATEFHQITEKISAELNAAEADNANETRFLSVLDFINRINVSVFAQYGFLGDIELRRLADMVVVGKISPARQEKAIKHLHNYLHQAPRATAKYLSKILKGLDSSCMPYGLTSLKIRLQSETVRRHQRLMQFPAAFQKQIEKCFV